MKHLLLHHQFLFLFLSLLSVVTVAAVDSDVSTPDWKHRSIYRLMVDRFNKITNAAPIVCPDLTAFCGGTIDAVTQELDYIQGMGFDAILMTPIFTQQLLGFDGRLTKDLLSIDKRFGTSELLLTLIEEVHKRNMLIMMDVVINHMGTTDQSSPTGDNDVSLNSPFNLPEHYHKKCLIDYSDETSVQNCRLGDTLQTSLPDLDTENAFVKSTLLSWIGNFTKSYQMDGYRVLDARYVPPSFYPDFVKAAGVFVMGDVNMTTNADLAKFQNTAGFNSVDNKVVYKSIIDIFSSNQTQSFADLASIINQQASIFKDANALSLFIEDHYLGRFLQTDNFGDVLPHMVYDITKFKSALTLLMTLPGIPMVLFGAEQEYSGTPTITSKDLWSSVFDVTTDMYTYLQSLNALRKSTGLANATMVPLLADNNNFVYARGSVLIAVSSQGQSFTSNELTIQNVPFDIGTTLIDVINPENFITVSQNKSLIFTAMYNKPYVFTVKNEQVQNKMEVLLEGVGSPKMNSAVDRRRSLVGVFSVVASLFVLF